MNKKMIIVFLCLMLCLFISISAVSSADNTVDGNDLNQSDTLKNTENDLQSYSLGSFSDLNARIANTPDNGVLVLDRDFSYIESEDTSFTNGIWFTKSLTIDGNGFTIDGCNKARIFGVGAQVGGGHSAVSYVVLKDINFKNAYNTAVNNKNDAYGAVEFWGTGNIINCNFTNNYAFCAAAMALGSGTKINVTDCRFINNTGYGQGGGAIRLRTLVHGLTISGCWFEDNYGDTYGGAVHSDMGKENGGCVVDNCDFVNNRARAGAGGLFFETPGGIVNNSRFRGNTAQVGGGIYWNGYNGTVINSNFYDNVASEYGGGIYCSGRSITNVSHSNFYNNSAKYGGGVAFQNSDGSAIYSCYFERNNAVTAYQEGNGGAIYCGGRFFNLFDSNFTKNKGDLGGSLYLDVGGAVRDCRFEYEHATLDGGSVYVVASTTALIPEGVEPGIIRSSFINCTAGRDGGSGFILAGNGSVRDSIFINCSAGHEGGASYMYGDLAKILNSTFINNHAGAGGALMWTGNRGTIYNSTFVNNKATQSNGGAVYLSPMDPVTDILKEASVINCSNFKDNVASVSGGAVYCSGLFSNIVYSNFTQDNATNGAGIYLDVGAYIYNCYFLKEHAFNDGGAFYLNATNTLPGFTPSQLAQLPVGAVSSRIFNCSAAHDGGAGYVKGDYGIVKNVTMAYCFAGNNGGAGYVSGDNGQILNSTFIDNVALNNGGALMWVGKGGNASKINFIHNTANNGNGGGVYLENSTSTSFYDSTFINNTAGNNGGAVDWHEGARDGLLMNSIFKFNKALNSGGAVYWNGRDGRVLNSNFTNNHAIGIPIYVDGGDGGSICWIGYNGTVQECNFNITTAKHFGGAIFVSGNHTFIVKSSFERYNATRGGSVYVEGNDVNISDSRFQYGEAQYGGAIYIDGENTFLVNSNLTRNHAIYDGGNIYINGNYTNIIHSNLKFSYVYGSGGSIYINGHHTLITKSNLTYNNASNAYGGSVYINGDSNNIAESVFEMANSIKGGAIYISGANTHISKSNFTKNKVNSTNYSETAGGTIYVVGENTVISQCSLSRSNAYVGGIIYVEGNDVNITKSTFDSSISALSGGAIYVGGADVTISDSTFQRHNSTSGGAIYVQGDEAHILNSNFTLTFAQGGNGGAIYVGGQNAHINGSDFQITMAIGGNGGAIYVGGVNSIINDCYANITKSIRTGPGNIGNGGVIYIFGDNAKVLNSRFERYNATDDGGALYILGHDAVISKSSFEFGEARNGGAIYINGRNTQLLDSNLTRSHANNNGGVIYISGNDAKINGSRFEFSYARSSGGTIYIEGANAKIMKSNFSYNNATDKGGSIYVAGNNTHIIESGFKNGYADYGALIYISGNLANITQSSFKDAAADVNGGAIYVDSSNASVSKSKFERLRAVLGGAIYLGGDKTLISDSNFTNNTAQRGGAIYVNSKDNNLTDSLFENNNASYGGAVLLANQDNSIESTIFNSNSATMGGAVYVDYDGNSIKNSTFNSNDATTSGGALYVAHTMNVRNSTFQANTALNYGGAIYSNSNSNEFTDLTLKANNVTSANGQGGAMYLTGQNNDISDSRFINNFANIGGALYDSATSLTIDNTNFTDNVANMGAAIGVNGLNSNIFNSEFSGNNATKGSAIYMTGTNLVIANTTFKPNRADAESLVIDVRDVNYYPSDFNVSVKFRGKDNLLNAIWNDKSLEDITLSKITYEIYKDGHIHNITTSDSYVHPVNGSLNSSYGDLIYQDTLEDAQKINFKIINNATGNVELDLTGAFTDIYGNITKVFSNLKPGNYTAYAEHLQDKYYTGINTTKNFQVGEILNITKEPSEVTVDVGQLINYTITIQNIANGAVGNITVFESIPDGFVIVNYTDSSKWSRNASKFTYNQILNARDTVTLVITFNATKAGKYLNTIAVSSNETSNITLNATENVTVYEPNMTVIKLVNVNETTVGSLINFTITVTNTGNRNISNIKVIEDIPEGFVYIRNNGNWTYDLVKTFTYAGGNLTVGQSINLIITFNVTKNGTFVNKVNVTSNIDKNFTNSSENITVHPKVNLTVVKTSNITGNASVGDLVNFTITVTNHGLSNATNVQIIDDLNIAFRFVNAAGNYTRQSQKVIWNISKLNNGASAIVWVVVRILNNGTFTNVALVNSTENATGSFNETNITVNTNVDFAVIKTGNVTNARVGDLVNFTITVTNKGWGNATDVCIIDDLNIAFAFVSANGTYTRNNQKVVWTFDRLANQSSTSVWVVVRLLNNGTFTNVALVNSTENKTGSFNQTNITVIPDVNLTVIKSGNVTVASVGDLVNFTITVTNCGLSNATNVQVIDDLNAAFGFVSANGTYTRNNQKVVWTFDRLANQSSTSVWVVVRLLNNGTFTNVALVNSTENKTGSFNETNITVNSKVNLTLIKSANVTNASVGDLVNFTITVTNRGPSNATNIQVFDELNSAFRFVNAGGNYTRQSQKVIWNISRLNNGSSVSVWVVVRLLTNGTFTNIALVNSTENKTANSNKTNITVNSKVNLTVIKSGNVTVASVGDLVNFTITVNNYGPSNATNVQVIDDLNAAFAFVSANGTYVKSGQKIVWTISKLNNGSSTSVWVVVRLLSNGTFTNIALVNSTENKTTNSNMTNITVYPDVNLTLVKSGNVTDARVGDLVNFTITVTNRGLSNATNVQVIDDLNAAFAFVSANGTYVKSGQKIVWTISKLNNGSSTSVWVVVRLLNNGTFTNIALVNSTENNNTKSNLTNITVVPDVNLTLVKSGNVTNASVGDLVNFTITVTNRGLSNATNIQITDDLNVAFEFVNAAGNYTRQSQKLVWTISKLGNGSSVSVWVVVRLLTNGTFTNIALANSTENRTGGFNQTNITVNSKVNLTLVKSVNVTSTIAVGELVNFTITVTNHGPSNATNVQIIDDLNPAFEFVNANGTFTKIGQKIVWTISKLNNGDSASVWVVVRLLTNGTFTNVAITNSTENKTGGFNETNVTAEYRVDFGIIKTSNITQLANEGDLANFTITITNYGPNNATGVQIIDTLSHAFEFRSANGTYSLNGQKIVWDIGNLNYGETTSVWLVVAIVDHGFYSNLAYVNSTENKTGNSNKTMVVVEPAVNITLFKYSNVTNTTAGSLVNFTIEVTNHGPSRATNVSVKDILPNGLEYYSSGSNITGVNGVNTGNIVIWNIPKLDKDGKAIVWVVVRVLTNGTFTNVASVNSTENTTGTTTDSKINADPTVDLSINKTVNTTYAKVEDTIKYTIVVVNNGICNATGVEVLENLKGNVELISVVESKGQYNKTTSKWTIGNLTVGEKVNLTIIIKILAMGTVENTVSVKSNENDTNTTNNNYTADNVTVSKGSVPIDLKTQNITYGEVEIINIAVPKNVTGFVNVTVGNKTFENLPIFNGTVTLPVPDLPGGNYPVNVTYSGDGNYDSNSTSGSFTVSRLIPTIKIEVVDIWYGEVEVLNVTVNAPGSVNITANGVTVTIGLDHEIKSTDMLGNNKLSYDGKATWNLINLPVGDYPVFAIYNGNENYTSVNTTDTFKVKPRNSTVVVSADDIYVGEDALIKVKVGPDGVTGNVTLTIDGRKYNVNLTNGSATLTVPGLKAGIKDVSVTYNGDRNFPIAKNTTKFTVKKLKPPITVDSYDIYVGDDEKITVTLPSDATGKVTITVGGKKYTADVKNGKAIFNIPNLKAGKYSVRATYGGDDRYVSVTGKDTFNVLKHKPTIDVISPDIKYGEDGKITVIVPKDATGKVTIEIDGKKYTTDVKNGKAVFNIPGLNVGKHKIKVSYSGDGKYLPANTMGSIKVSGSDGGVDKPQGGLSEKPTGNPILLLVLVFIALIPLRRIKK